MSAAARYDYVLVGGGLQAGLLVLAIRHHHPHARVLVLEKAAQLGGNHTWSFHATDIPEVSRDWCADLPARYWNGYSVAFPDFQRQMNLSYGSIHSVDLAETIHEQAAAATQDRPLTVLTEQTVTRLTSHQVNTADGRNYEGAVVVDCRGLPETRTTASSELGYQKFHGIEVLIGEDWPNETPVLMDSRISQADGFRFRYVLPFSRRRVLVEDTCFSDHRWIDHEECRRQSRRYLHQQGIDEEAIIREEYGCLPMPYGRLGPLETTLPLRGGYAGGWFHAATGYSFALAVRFAEAVASSSSADVLDRIRDLAAEHEFRRRFARFLNRMLFRMVRPETRWQIFRRFYRVLSEEAIARFYAHEFTRGDAAKLLIGIPPAGLTPIRFFKSYEAVPCPAAF